MLTNIERMQLTARFALDICNVRECTKRPIRCGFRNGIPFAACEDHHLNFLGDPKVTGGVTVFKQTP